MVKRKTDKEFQQEVHDLVGNEYMFLDPYINAQTKLKVKHNKCGHIYKVKPSHFLNGTRCPYCSKRKTDAEFKKEVFDLVGNEYVFLDSYVNTHAKLRVKHNKCGNIYKLQPSSFLTGHRCPDCSGKHQKTNAEFKQEIYDLVGDEYTFLDTYVNNSTKIKIRHNKCGNVYKTKPNTFLLGSRCPYCAGYMKKTDAQFKKEVFDLVGDEYTFLNAYVNNKTKLRVKHNKCGYVYKVTPTDFFHKHNRCSYCNSPKGETIITKLLDTLNINYEPQKTFDDLRDTQPLSYDFFVPDQNILIEYQGIQHYEPIDYFGGNSAFERQQKHDKMKANYAKDHGYNLIAVPYTEDNFSKIKKYLLQHGLSK